MTTTRPPCPVCRAKSGHHRAGCPARGKRRGRKSKAVGDKYTRRLISFAPDVEKFIKAQPKGEYSAIVMEALRIYYKDEIRLYNLP